MSDSLYQEPRRASRDAVPASVCSVAAHFCLGCTPERLVSKESAASYKRKRGARIVGYADIGNGLLDQPTTVLTGNPYGPRMAIYTSREFQQAAQAEADWINEQMEGLSDARCHELARIFSEATRLEADLWQMGLTLQDEKGQRDAEGDWLAKVIPSMGKPKQMG